MSKIEWTGETWNPVVGCSVVSPGCTNCYAMGMAARLEAMAGDGLDDNGYAVRGTGPLDHYRKLTTRSKAGPVWTGKVALAPEKTLLAPLKRRKPTTYFVNSMGDLFHEAVPDEWIDRVFAVMALCPQHTFQVLTKRSARMRAYIDRVTALCDGPDGIYPAILAVAEMMEGPSEARNWAREATELWPIPNVWLGVSTEDQRRADERIPDLLATPAAVRFVSAEPLLGPIDFTELPSVSGIGRYLDALSNAGAERSDLPTRLDWIIVGGESGPNARPMHPDWARSIRDQCIAAGVPFFFKQWGQWALFADGDADPDQSLAHRNDWMLVERDGGVDAPDHRWPSKDEGQCAMLPVGKKRAGRLLDGREWNEMPNILAPLHSSMEDAS